MTGAIDILNASPLMREHLGELSGAVSSLFRLPVRARQFEFDFDEAYDGSRRQYNSTVLVAQMLAAEDSPKMIAIVDVDLYIPVLTFIFGEAQFGGRAAIVSTYRLNNVFYGLREDQPVLLHRLEKEVVHELGHTYGLYHCRQFECVMRSSTYVEEIDLKRALPCGECMNVLQATFNHPVTS